MSHVVTGHSPIDPYGWRISTCRIALESTQLTCRLELVRCANARARSSLASLLRSSMSAFGCVQRPASARRTGAALIDRSAGLVRTGGRELDSSAWTLGRLSRPSTMATHAPVRARRRRDADFFLAQPSARTRARTCRSPWSFWDVPLVLKAL